MRQFVIPLAPLVYSWKALLVANPVVGVAVGTVAIVGYAIYEEVTKNK